MMSVVKGRFASCSKSTARERRKAWSQIHASIRATHKQRLQRLFEEALDVSTKKHVSE